MFATERNIITQGIHERIKIHKMYSNINITEGYDIKVTF